MIARLRWSGTRRRRVVRACALALSVCAAASISAAEIENITSGDVIDGSISVVVRAQGVHAGTVHVVFERSSLALGRVTERGVYQMTSTDGGATFGAVTPLRDLPGVDEGAPTLIETSAGILYCYFVTDASGVSKLWWGNSSDGINWTFSAVPLDLGWGAAVPVGRPSAAAGPAGDGLLAYENQQVGSLHVATLLGYIDVDRDRLQVSATGLEPSLIRHPDDSYWLSHRQNPLSTAVLVDRSLDGMAWSSSAIVPAPDVPMAPELTVLNNSAVALFLGVRPTAGTGKLHRALAVAAGAFGPLEAVPMGSQAVDAREVFALRDDVMDPDSVGVYFAKVTQTPWERARLARVVMDACDRRPSFFGLASADDLDACAVSGILLRWPPVASWGSAVGGEYEVHRSTVSGFVPDVTTRLDATTATEYVDDTALADISYSYRIVAVGEEACVALPGGANRGLEDTNGIELTVEDRGQVALPGEVADLRLAKSALGDVTLSWPAVTAADGYQVFASGVPDRRTFTQLTVSPATAPWALPAGGGALTYYLVRAQNACGELGL